MTICVKIIETLYCAHTIGRKEFHNPYWTYSTDLRERFCEECNKEMPLAEVTVGIIARNEAEIKEWKLREIPYPLP
jgi:hypothetical protein